MSWKIYGLTRTLLYWRQRLYQKINEIRAKAEANFSMKIRAKNPRTNFSFSTTAGTQSLPCLKKVLCCILFFRCLAWGKSENETNTHTQIQQKRSQLLLQPVSEDTHTNCEPMVLPSQNSIPRQCTIHFTKKDLLVVVILGVHCASSVAIPLHFAFLSTLRRCVHCSSVQQWSTAFIFSPF